MAVTAGNLEKERLREIVTRMISGEKSLHVKRVGDYKLVRIGTIPWALLDHHKSEVARRKIKYMKSYKGIDFYKKVDPHEED